MIHNTARVATERLRQPDGKDRRQDDGWRRLTIWLTPHEADTLQTLGDEWLERRVKALLADPMGGKEAQPLSLHAGHSGEPVATPRGVSLAGELEAATLAERGRTIALLFRLGMNANEIAAVLHLELSEVTRVLAPAAEGFTLRGEPTPPESPQEQCDLMREVDTLLAQGLSGTDIALQFNAAGRRTPSGAEYCGASLIRNWRRWKGAAI